MHNFFFKIHNVLQRHKTLGFVLLFFFVAFIVFFASRIDLEEDVSRLIPSGERQDVLKKVLNETNFSDKIIVTVSSTSAEENPGELTRYAERFLDSVENQLPQYIDEIQGKVPEEGVMEVYDFVYDNLPLFLNEGDYVKINQRIKEDSIRQRLRRNYKNLISPTGLVTKEFIFKDPLSVTSLGLEKLQELRVGDNFELYNDFLITRDRRHLLLFITPALPASETDKNEEFIYELQNIQKNLNASYEDVEGSFFGGVLYSLANANRIKSDIQLTISIAAGVLLILLIFFYRRVYVPLILFIPSLIGGLTAIALLYFLKGNISAISVGIGAILLGISLDYALHILTHYRNNHDVEQLYKEVSRPVLMSSLTTATAFLCLLFVKSQALNDLGLFAAISVVVASVFALILIPLFYKIPDGTEPRQTFIDKVASITYYKKKPLVVVVILMFITGLFFFTRVEFNNDISKLNYEPETLKQAEADIKNIAGRSGKAVYLVSYGYSIDEALLRNNNLYSRLQEPQIQQEIKNYSSIGGVVLSTNTQNQRIEKWEEFWTEAKKNQLKQNLIEYSADFGFKPQSFQHFYQLLEKDFDNLFLEDYRNIGNLYLDDFISTGEDFATVATRVSLNESEMRSFIEHFEDMEGVLVIDRQEVNQNFLGNLKNDFNRLIGYSLVAVFVILLLFYRNLEISILTLLPIGITWVIALAIMAVSGIELNILNIIISTFIFGLGLDYSIFITNASLRKYEFGTSTLATYQTSILISVITTLLGIGALIFAKHPALRSVSVVSVIGVISAVLVAFVLQTWFFYLLFIRPVNKGQPAFGFHNLFRKRKNHQKDRLYYKEAVLDNYRYKSVYDDVKSEFAEEKERYLKVSSFIDKEDRVLDLSPGFGLLPVYLSYKNPSAVITGFQPGQEKLQIAAQCFRTRHHYLKFTPELNENELEADVIILSATPDEATGKRFKELIKRSAKKVIILDPKIPHRWIIDLDFEISYRQKQMLVLSKTV